MRRWRVLRFASTLIAFALLLGLTACGGGRMVAAPVGSPQSPSAASPGASEAILVWTVIYGKAIGAVLKFLTPIRVKKRLVEGAAQPTGSELTCEERRSPSYA